ncbi:MAG: hypothetical protein J6Q68_04320 [Clostridia bacterium]|nr:hypothetical protein [Clostridia bacterium]
MKISGSGSICAGEYTEAVKISGSGKLCGNIKCKGFSSRGTVKGSGDIISDGTASTSGYTSIYGSLKATEDVTASGTTKIGGAITSEKNISASGTLKCGSDIKCEKFKMSGSLTVNGGIEAEEIKTSGKVTCCGFINAESTEIGFSYCENTVYGIGGANVSVHYKNEIFAALPVISKLLSLHKLRIIDSIEGDIVSLSGVIAPKVTGRVVNIGAGCEIERVFYSESITIDPHATVKNFEKTN